MGKVVAGITMSLDGFINDRDGGVGRLYPDLGDLGQTEMMQEEIAATGAVVMGRHAFDMANGDYTGYEFQTPIFVLTHQAPAQPVKGENENLKVYFVDDLARAVAQAKAAAGERNVSIIGGADTAQQCIRLGLVEQLQIGIMPVLLGGGLRFFEHLGPDAAKLVLVDVIQTGGGRVDLRYEVIR